MAEKKSIVFDSGPIISFTLNNLLWLLEPLKKKFGGEFLISEETKKELVDRPMDTKKFKFEAYQIIDLLKRGVLTEVMNKEIEEESEKMLEVANNCYYIKAQPLTILHKADACGLVLANREDSRCFVVDERTERLLVENPLRLRNLLERRMHAGVRMNKDNIRKFMEISKGAKMIRSVELATVAYELGLLDKYVEKGEYGKRNLLDALLWALKLNGCAVSEDEIEQIIKIESKR